MALNAKKLREQLAAKMDEVAAVNSICEKENREPTAEEVAIINAAIGEDGKGGEAAALRNRLKQAEAFEAEMDALARARNAIPGGVHHEQAGVGDSGSVFSRIKIPARAAARQPVTAFRGPDNEKKAFAFGRFVAGVMGDDGAREWCKDQLGHDFRAGMTEGSDSAGGIFVPDEYEADIIRLVNEYGAFRPNARRVAMSRDTKTTPRRTGGLTAYFIGEESAPTQSTMTADGIKLTAKDVGALTTFSSDLDEDSAVSLGNEIAIEMALAFAYKEDICGFSGDGTSTYGGIVGLKNALAAGSTVTAATGNTSFGTLDLDDFESMLAALPSYAFRDGGPKWYIHRSGWAKSMLRLAAAAGGNTAREVEGGYRTQFLGYDVVFVEVMNNTLTTQTSTSGLCYVGNMPMAARFGDRKGMTMATSKEVGFTTRQTYVLGVERFDINVHDKGDASNAGAMVMLSTPGS